MSVRTQSALRTRDPLDPAGQHDVAPRTARYVLIAIVALAFFVRVVYVLQSRASPLFDAPQMDALYHVEWARALARGEAFQPGPFFRAPGYPWFLAALTWLFGDGLLAPRLVQAAIGAASCALVYLVGARAFDRRTGLVAAALAAGYWMLVYFDGELLLPVLEVPTCLVAILMAQRFAAQPSAARLAWAGAALGVAAIVRPNVLLWGACVALWLVARGHADLRRRVRDAVLYALAVAAPILPVTAYNSFVGHDRVLISTQGGVNFWIGNNPTSDGSTAIAPGTRPDWWGGYHDTVQQAEAAEGRTLRPSEVSRHYAQRAWSWMASDPWAAVKHLAWKARLYWTDWELGNNQDEVFFAQEFGPIVRWLPFTFGVVAPLGILGWLLSARRWREIGPLWLFVPAWSASVIAFFVCARFRIPMIPVLGVFAAHALVFAVDLWRRRSFASLGVFGVAIAILAILAQAVPRQVDRTPSLGLWQLGVMRAQDGDFEEAIELYRRAIEANPRKAFPHQDLGLALIARSQPAEALPSLAEALRLSPGASGALQGRVDALWALGRPAEALAAANELVRAAPLLSGAHYTLARALMFEAEAARRAVPTAARTALERALEVANTPDETFNTAFALGELERTTGRPREAIPFYERALRARPEPDAAGWHARCQAALREAQRAAGTNPN